MVPFLLPETLGEWGSLSQMVLRDAFSGPGEQAGRTCPCPFPAAAFPPASLVAELSRMGGATFTNRLQAVLAHCIQELSAALYIVSHTPVSHQYYRLL